MIALEDINKSYYRLKPFIAKTPLSIASSFKDFNSADIYLKKENLQLTGSFKIRGAFNRISQINKTKSNGVLAVSAGNHAQGVAYAAKHFNIDAVIFMPTATPLLKINGTKNLGAKVILEGDNYDEAYAAGLQYAKSNNLTLVHPFADDEVIAGQGSLAIETFQQKEDLSHIIVPIGGGGLISGVAFTTKCYFPDIKVIGVTASGAPAMRNSFIKKKIINSKSVKTIADGIAVRDVSGLTFNYITKFVDDIVEVNDEEIANAILYMIEKEKLVVEGAGVVGVAAVLHEKIKLKAKDKVSIVLSGGNIDVSTISVIIEKGLLKSFRKMKLNITLIDKPGSLQNLSNIFTQLSANIVQIDYNRVSRSVNYGDAQVNVTLETKGESHQMIIKEKLIEHNIKFVQEE